MVVGPPSIGRGVLAALVAAAIAIPVLPIALAVTGMSEMAMLAKLFHVHRSSGSDLNETERAVGAWLVALSTGFATGGLAGYWSCRLVRGGQRALFVGAASLLLGLLLAATGIIGHLRPTRAHFLDTPLLALCWLAATIAFVFASDPRFLAEDGGKKASGTVS